MSLGFWQIALIIILFLLLFGRGKIPQLMSDMAQGIKSFKDGVRDDERKDIGSTEQPHALRDDAGSHAVETDSEQHTTVKNT